MISFSPPKKPFLFYVILFTVSIIIFRIINHIIPKFYEFQNNSLTEFLFQIIIFISIVFLSSLLLEKFSIFRENSKSYK